MAQLSEFSTAQQATVVLFSKAVSLGSIVASSTIVYKIASNRTRRRQVKERMIVGMSCFDALYSLALFVGSWAFPSDSGVWGAAGSNSSCSVQGFLAMLGVGVLGVGVLGCVS